MPISKTYDFLNSGDYTSSNCSHSAGTYVLGTGIVAQSFTNDMSSSSGATYDTLKAEFSGGVFRQKSQAPSGCLFATTFQTQDLDWALSGSLTGTLLGSATITSGKLVCTGYANKAVRYDNAQITSITTQGCIRFRYTPNYTGIPSSDCSLFSIRRSSDDQNLITLSHSATAGRFYIATITSSMTVAFYNLLDGSGWLPTSGTSYEFEFNFNTVTGAFALFIDGVSVATRTIVYTRTGTADKLYIGAQGGVFTTANGSFDDVMIFNTVQHTAGFSTGYVCPTVLYSETSLENTFSSLGPSTFQGINSISESGVTNSPKYIISGLYWTGSSWIASNGTYAQANTLADVNFNCSLIPVSSSTITWKIVFPDSVTLGEISAFSASMQDTQYLTSGYVEPVLPVITTDISSLLVTSTEPSGTGIRACLKIDGAYKYWNGTIWTTSDGSYAQSNTQAQLVTGLPSLVISSTATIFIRWVLSSSVPNLTPTLSDSVVSYEFGALPTDVSICTVYGFIKDISGNAISGVTVNFQLSKAQNQYIEANQNIILNKVISVTSGANGLFSCPLIRDSEFTESLTYKIILTKDGLTVNKSGTKDILFTVPDLDTKDITELLPQV